MEDSSIAVVLDGLPTVHPSQVNKLSGFVLHRLNDVDSGDHNKVLMPVAGQLSLGFCIVRFPTIALAEEAIQRLNGYQIDMNHQMTVEKVEQSDRFRQAERQNLVEVELIPMLRLLDIAGAGPQNDAVNF